jgi:hypothetical protein
MGPERLIIPMMSVLFALPWLPFIFYVADCEAANQNAEHPAAEAWGFYRQSDFSGRNLHLRLRHMTTALELLETMMLKQPCTRVEKAGQSWQFMFGKVTQPSTSNALGGSF